MATDKELTPLSDIRELDAALASSALFLNKFRGWLGDGLTIVLIGAVYVRYMVFNILGH